MGMGDRARCLSLVALLLSGFCGGCGADAVTRLDRRPNGEPTTDAVVEDAEVEYATGAESIEALHLAVIAAARSQDLDAFLELWPSVSMVVTEQRESIRAMAVSGEIEDAAASTILDRFAGEEHRNQTADDLNSRARRHFETVTESIARYGIPEDYDSSALEVMLRPADDGAEMAVLRYVYSDKPHSAVVGGRQWPNGRYYADGSGSFGQ